MCYILPLSSYLAGSFCTLRREAATFRVDFSPFLYLFICNTSFLHFFFFFHPPEPLRQKVVPAEAGEGGEGGSEGERNCFLSLDFI